MARVVVFVASTAEIKKSSIASEYGPHQISVCYTGLGKIRAAVAAHEQLTAASFDIAVNLGTSGSHRLPIGTLAEVSAFVERDVDLSAAGLPLGVFPGADGRIVSPKKYLKNLSSVICGTGDRIDLKPPAVPCDIYDMEGFALAFVCQKLSLPFVSIKFISDSSTSGLGDEWKKSLAQAQDCLNTNFKQFLKIIS